jgi:hypothetical protein
MDLQNKPDALPPLAPFTDGKRIHIKPIEDYIEALEITLPKGFELSYDDNGELENSVRITGPGLEIEIGPPEAGFFTLAEHMVIYRNNDKPPVFYRAEETKEGYLLLVGNLDSEVGYQVTVSRPNLKVTCFAGRFVGGSWVEMDTLEKADLAASICLSLRAAQPN